MGNLQWDSIHVSLNGRVIQTTPYNTETNEYFCYKCDNSKLFEFQDNLYGCDKCKTSYEIKSSGICTTFKELT